MGVEAAGLRLSVEMAEGATRGQTNAVRACLRANALVTGLTEKTVTYEVSHIERRAG
jgi:hypothetical protein